MSVQPSDGARPQLRRVLRLWDSIALIVGLVVGSGIFRTPTDVARELDSLAAVILVWVLGGVVALCGSLAHAELASAWPRTGGTYVYLRECFGSLTSFLFGWAQLWVIRPAVVAGIAVIFAQYVAHFVPVSQTGVKLIAVLGIVAVSLINYMGVRFTSLVQNTLTSIKFLALLVIAYVGLFHVASPDGFGPWLPTSIDWSYGTALGAALVLVFWTYDGWSEIVLVAGEIREPARTIPKALLIGTFSIVVLYVLVNAAYVNVLTMGGVAASDRVATDAMIRVIGQAGGSLIAMVVVVSTLSALVATMLTGPRIFFAMALDGLFFSWARRIDPKYRTPSTAIALQAFLAVPLVITWTFEQLANYYVYVSLIFYALTTVAVFRLRRMPQAPKASYKTWGYPWTPLFFLVVSGGIMLNVFFTSLRQVMVGSAILLAGVPAYYLWKGRRKPIRRSTASEDEPQA